MLPDTHIHTAFSGDCSTPAAIQIERCISMGMQEVCITDHHDYDTGMKEEIFLLDFPAYLSRLHSLREEDPSAAPMNGILKWLSGGSKIWIALTPWDTWTMWSAMVPPQIRIIPITTIRIILIRFSER